MHFLFTEQVETLQLTLMLDVREDDEMLLRNGLQTRGVMH